MQAMISSGSQHQEAGKSRPGTVMRRLALGGLAWLLTLAGCATSVPFNNPFMPRTIEVSQVQLLAQMSTQFPINRRLLDFFDVTVATPQLTMLPQENRVVTELAMDTGPTLLTEGYKGRLALSYGLRYEASDQSVRLTEVRMERFRLDGVPDALQPRTARLGGLLAEGLLDGFTVYRFKPEDLKIVLGLGFKPSGIYVTGQGLALTLEPTRTLAKR